MFCSISLIFIFVFFFKDGSSLTLNICQAISHHLKWQKRKVYVSNLSLRSSNQLVACNEWEQDSRIFFAYSILWEENGSFTSEFSDIAYCCS